MNLAGHTLTTRLSDQTRSYQAKLPDRNHKAPYSAFVHTLHDTMYSYIVGMSEHSIQRCQCVEQTFPSHPLVSLAMLLIQRLRVREARKQSATFKKYLPRPSQSLTSYRAHEMQCFAPPQIDWGSGGHSQLRPSKQRTDLRAVITGKKLWQRRSPDSSLPFFP